MLDWDELPVSRVEDGHMRLANEALAVLCQENDQRYRMHYITNDCAEIVLNKYVLEIQRKYVVATDL